MTDINAVIINGRLTKDIELKYIKETAVGKFAIAVNSSRKNDSGEYEDEVSYFDCTYFGKMAESLKRYLIKGQQVSIQGRLKQNRWKDKETGDNRSAVYILVNSLQLIGGNKNSSGGESYEGGNKSQYKSHKEESQSYDDYETEDGEEIPF